MNKCCNFTAEFEELNNLSAEFDEEGRLGADFGETQIVSTDDYNDLFNKPKINSIEVRGDKTGAEYRLQDKMDNITEQMIDTMIFGG